MRNEQQARRLAILRSATAQRVGSKQIYAIHSLAQANEQYVFQTELIGANARAQEIANVKRKNFLAVEQLLKQRFPLFEFLLHGYS